MSENPNQNPNPMPLPEGATVAVMAHQIGEIKHAVDQSNREARDRLDDHGKRITALEEMQIRQDERGKTEDRLRSVLAERTHDDVQRSQNRVTVRLSRWQVWCALVVALASIASVVAIALSAH